MTERLHRKRDLTVAEAVQVVLMRRDQPALSGFLTRRDVERAARVLADHVVEQHREATADETEQGSGDGTPHALLAAVARHDQDCALGRSCGIRADITHVIRY